MYSIPFLFTLLQYKDYDIARLRKSQTNPWEDAHEGILSLSSPVRDLLLVVLILGAVVTLVLGVLKLMDGDRDGAKRMAAWLIGFVLGSTFLYILL